ncbi:hypothetical protein CWI75_09030 [Kineobactrum sediminis]|uniref:Translocation and assembly module subunit TamA n=1 Tax=Kineobactrum sediminis TaxID=1905677 RepID=A0A2N5Y2T9_9GAMM|nr:autotransporter assembly complex family protein [Kineobactrum sediminis]PLW82712.1 hypothetical protein CWI75_09030 [Kineobactrum sediminis]
MRYPWITLLLAGIACGANAAPTLTYKVDVPGKPLADNVRAWLGNPPETVPARANFMVSARRRVEQSLQALGYYRPDIDLALDRDRDPWRLRIIIDPGEPVTVDSLTVTLTGAASEDEAFAELLANKPLNEGDVLHHGRYERLKNGLLALGQRRGYFDAELLEKKVTVEAGAGLAQVRLHYASGDRYQFGELRLNEEVVSRDLLAKLQPFAEGDPYTLGGLQTLQSDLQRTGYFSGITLQPQLSERADQRVPLDLELFPAKRHSFDLGIGYSTDTEQRLSVTWRTPKINRLGHSQETRLEYSAINPSGRTTYNIPLTHPLDDILQLQARVELNEFGDLESRQREASVRREQRKGNWIVSYHFRALNETWDANPISETEDYLLPGFTVAHKWRKGSLVNPRRGFSQFYTVEGTSTQAGSNIDMVRIYGNWINVVSVGERHRLVNRLEAGAAFIGDGQRPALAPSLSFFAGGSQSLRGFDYQSIGNRVSLLRTDGEPTELVVGGNRLLVGSLEYQYRFLPAWRAALFVDAGDAFDEGEFEANYGAGFGVHYLTQVGPIKLELANGLSKDNPAWRIHINIGAEF